MFYDEFTALQPTVPTPAPEAQASYDALRDAALVYAALLDPLPDTKKFIALRHVRASLIAAYAGVDAVTQ